MPADGMRLPLKKLGGRSARPTGSLQRSYAMSCATAIAFRTPSGSSAHAETAASTL
jgi:hypothetical protein